MAAIICRRQLQIKKDYLQLEILLTGDQPIVGSRSRETDGICRRAFDGSVSMCQMPVGEMDWIRIGIFIILYWLQRLT